MKTDHVPYALSVANRTAMTFGEVTYANVVKLLTSTGLNATAHPTGISIQRFAAMVVQATKIPRT